MVQWYQINNPYSVFSNFPQNIHILCHFNSVQNLIKDHTLIHNWTFHELPFLKLICLLKNQADSTFSHPISQILISIYMKERNMEGERKEIKEGGKEKERQCITFIHPRFFIVHCTKLEKFLKHQTIR